MSHRLRRSQVAGTKKPWPQKHGPRSLAGMVCGSHRLQPHAVASSVVASVVSRRKLRMLSNE
eukprot:220318-Pelagomonas_calceolata.AAC.5